MSGTDNIILDLTTAEIVACYNKISKIEVKKFKDRKTAELRLHGLAHADTAKFIKAMKAVKVRGAIITKYESELAEEAKKLQAKTEREQAKAAEREKAAQKPAPSPKAKPEVKKMNIRTAAGVQSDDPDFAAAAQVLLEAQSKLKGKELEAAQAIIAHERKPQRGLPTELAHESRAAAVLWFIQSIMKQHKTKHEEEMCTSHDISVSANITVDVAIKELDILKHLGCVEIEDDTAVPSDPFYYVTLTEKGSKFELGSEQPVIKAGKEPKTKREPKGPRTPREPGAPRAARGNLAGMKIYKLVKDNPRREGSIGFTSFALITNGMLYEDYLKAGGRPGDVKWDLEHGFIELRQE